MQIVLWICRNQTVLSFSKLMFPSLVLVNYSFLRPWKQNRQHGTRRKMWERQKTISLSCLYRNPVTLYCNRTKHAGWSQHPTSERENTIHLSQCWLLLKALWKSYLQIFWKFGFCCSEKNILNEVVNSVIWRN